MTSWTGTMDHYLVKIKPLYVLDPGVNYNCHHCNISFLYILFQNHRQLELTPIYNSLHASREGFLQDFGSVGISIHPIKKALLREGLACNSHSNSSQICSVGSKGADYWGFPTPILWNQVITWHDWTWKDSPICSHKAVSIQLSKMSL